ncbi:lysophosphatidic acid receptor 2-like [Protopterus annectens]|uniref:lysophosphatidic acid receptor 2-like n=1 Tax=Protopterus annectens TaxID=7888 RepID=UPI001CFA27D4|nr:lysophosphatidic acid receptor 2-like [Protopterus annectens]
MSYPKTTLTPKEVEKCYYNATIAFFYNNSKKELATAWTPYSILVVTLGLMVSVIVIVANVLVLIAIFKNRRFHFPIYYLLGNLAAADIFAGISYMYLMFHTGPRTNELTVPTWLLRQGLIDTSLTASVANLLAIAAERHQTIFTMQLHSKMSNRRVFILITCIWLSSILMGSIPSMGWHCICSIKTCSRMAPLYSRSYLISWAVLNLTIFLIMVIFYGRIFIYVQKKTTRMSQHTTYQPKYKDTMVNLMKTVVIILSAFVICWTPGLIILLLDGVGCITCNVLDVEKFFLLLAEINSVVNPIVYSYRDTEMRNTFRQIICFWEQTSKYGKSVKSNTTVHRRILSENGHAAADSTL